MHRRLQLEGGHSPLSPWIAVLSTYTYRTHLLHRSPSNRPHRRGAGRRRQAAEPRCTHFRLQVPSVTVTDLAGHACAKSAAHPHARSVDPGAPKSSNSPVWHMQSMALCRECSVCAAASCIRPPESIPHTATHSAREALYITGLGPFTSHITSHGRDNCSVAANRSR